MAEISYRTLSAEETAAFKHPFLPDIEVNPANVRIVVAEKGGELVGFQCLIAVLHLEPIWVHPDYRKTTVAARLFRKAASLLDEFHTKVAYCFSETPLISNYLQRLGLRKLSYETYLYDPLDIYPKEGQ